MCISPSQLLTICLSLGLRALQTQKYMPELPTMMLCRIVLALMTSDSVKHEKLTLTFYQNLATKYRMVQRILFGFPSLLTVEACVGLLSRMTNNPYFAKFGGSQLGSSRTRQVPYLSLTFGETMHFGGGGGGTASGRGTTVLSGRQPGILSRRNSYSSIRRTSVSSISSNGSANGSGVAVKNPEVLLRQYRLFVESPCGSQKKRLDQYSEPLFLRLRYRCRNTFLQEIMSHMVGSFEEGKRVYNMECYQFSGIFGTSSGQREKSEIYLTPRALVVVRTMNRQTHEFEFRSIEEVVEATSVPDAVVLTMKKKLKYLYSEHARVIVQKMKDLAGAIGVRIKSVRQEQLPQQQVKVLLDQTRLDAYTWLDVRKRTERHGPNRYRPKKVCVVDGTIREVDSTSDKTYALRSLRRVVVPRASVDDTDAVVALEFSDGSRVVYAPSNLDTFLGVVYDGFRFVNNWGVSFSREFSKINTRLTTRALLKDDLERYFYLNHDGLYVPAHAQLATEIENAKDEGLAATSATDKVMFGFEYMTINVRADDFTGKTLQTRVAQLSFGSVLRGISILVRVFIRLSVRVVCRLADR